MISRYHAERIKEFVSWYFEIAHDCRVTIESVETVDARQSRRGGSPERIIVTARGGSGRQFYALIYTHELRDKRSMPSREMWKVPVSLVSMMKPIVKQLKAQIIDGQAVSLDALLNQKTRRIEAAE